MQERLTDASWRALPYLPAPPGGGSGGPEASRLTVLELRQIRQVVSVLLGSDSQMFVRETSVGPGYETVRVMVAVPRALPRRLASQAALADRLGGLLSGKPTGQGDGDRPGLQALGRTPGLPKRLLEVLAARPKAPRMSRSWPLLGK